MGLRGGEGSVGGIDSRIEVTVDIDGGSGGFSFCCWTCGLQEMFLFFSYIFFIGGRRSE